jgi:hypothetical protein
LEEHVTPKPVPLGIQKIGIGVELTLIDTITHAFEVFRTLDIVLKDTYVTQRPWSKPIPLAEPIDTIGEKHVDDLATNVEQVFLGD